MSRPYLTAAILLLLNFPCFAGLPAALDANGEMRLSFEPSSSRLPPSEVKRLDGLAIEMAERDQRTLILLVPATDDPGTARFLTARAALVEEDLNRRGITVERRRTVALAPTDDVLVLRVPASKAEPTAKGAAPSKPVSDGPVPLTPPNPSPGQVSAEPTPVKVDIAVVPTVPAPPSPPPPAEERWSVPAGRMLRDVLGEWAVHAGWTVVWRSDRDFPLDAPASFQGDFLSAATRLFEGFATAVPAPLGHFYKGNKVLVVISGEEK
jgi:hypothetical protein